MKFVTALALLLFAGGIYFVARGTVVLGVVVLLLGLFDAVVAASLRGSITRRVPNSQLGHLGPASHVVWRVLFVAGSFAAIGAAVGASGGVGLAVGLAIFAGLLALFASLLVLAGSRPGATGADEAERPRQDR